MKTPAYRFLRGYTLDPGFSTMLDTYKVNETVYQIDWEAVEPGPSGAYLEVVDVDHFQQCYYDPIDLNQAWVMANQGLRPSEGNPQFHQQFVYTIGMLTIGNFEKALGRKVIWGPLNPGDTELPKLRIYPHAFQEANAYYYPRKKAILFGYFQAGDHYENYNFPGGTVFTCLSPDIIAHEMTHAILDSIHPLFLENTNVDVAAFHEGFADVVALLQRFATIDLIKHQLERSRGRLDRETVFGSLAKQLGTAIGPGNNALREAIGYKDENGIWVEREPNVSEFRKTSNAHKRGSYLVSAIFDAFVDLYHFKCRNLFRIAGISEDFRGDLSTEMVLQLAQIASEVAQNLLQICIQALDYVPPFDITFGDYLRALVTADIEMAPSDEYGYRISLIQAFRNWGIFPDRLNNLSTESLMWTPFDQGGVPTDKTLKNLQKKMRLIVVKLLAIKDRRSFFEQSKKYKESLEQIFLRKQKERDEYCKNEGGDAYEEWDGFIHSLGLTNDPFTFEYKGQKLNFGDVAPPIQVHSLRPVYRYSREGRKIEHLLVTLTQTIEIKEGAYKGLKFMGGSSVILDLEKDGAIEYLIYKNIKSRRRFLTQMAFQFGEVAQDQKAMVPLYDEDSDTDSLNFHHLHQSH
ncbi:MAG: hypothetical protein AAF242_03595 [Bacteroidota bacterium]